MNEHPAARGHRMSACDRQMLVAAYWPVIAYGAVLIAARLSFPRGHQLQGSLR